MRFIILFLFAVLSAPVIAQELPQSVTGPYLVYEAAAEAGDMQTAAQASEQAWRAGEREQIDPAILTILADNADVNID